MTELFILTGLAILAMIICLVLNERSDNKDTRFCTCMIACVFAMFSLGGLSSILSQDYPTAMDVYRGNTTLKVTYVDSVAIDSVVIFKIK